MATIYGGSSKAIPQRVLLMVNQTLILGFSLWVLLFGGDAVLSAHSSLALTGGHPTRRALLVAAMVVLYLRMSATVLVLVRRAIPWAEAMSIPAAFAVYYVGFTLLGAGNAAPPGLLFWLGALLFVAGSVINTLSEILRDRWKRHPENKGKLYTGGLFRYAVHINYFGDVLWVAGFAALAGSLWGWIFPVLLFCFFKFFNAPMLDRHMAEHYGEPFEAYRSSTASIIPFLW